MTNDETRTARNETYKTKWGINLSEGFKAEQMTLLKQIYELINKVEDLGQQKEAHYIIAIIKELCNGDIASLDYIKEKVSGLFNCKLEIYEK